MTSQNKKGDNDRLNQGLNDKACETSLILPDTCKCAQVYRERQDLKKEEM